MWCESAAQDRVVWQTLVNMGFRLQAKRVTFLGLVRECYLSKKKCVPWKFVVHL
jgi:hypothetical protein